MPCDCCDSDLEYGTNSKAVGKCRDKQPVKSY